MFVLSQLAGFGADPENVAEIAFQASAVDPTNATTFTFSSQALGAAHPTRKIIVALVGGGGSTATVSTVTVGGVSASAVAQSGLDTEALAELWVADVPTGTSGDVVVTFTGAKGQCGIGVFRMINSASSVHDTATATTENPSAENLDVPRNGVAVGVVNWGHTTTRSTTWTNLTEDYDEIVEASSAAHSGASQAFSDLQTALTITATPSGTTTFETFALASWGPAT